MPPLTNVRGATEVWMAVRRHFFRPDESPCPACGRVSKHEIIGVGVPDGKITGEEMARRLCYQRQDYIFPLPANVALPESPMESPRGYYPLRGDEPVKPDE